MGQGPTPKPLIIVDPTGASGVATQNPTGDGMAASAHIVVHNTRWNGTTYDREYGNIDLGKLITATGATTTQTSATQINPTARGIKVVLQTTTIGTGSVTLHIQWEDAGTGTWTDLLVGAAVTTNVTNVYDVYPGRTAVANVTANDVLPRNWRVQVVANNANAATYSVSANLIV